MSVSMRLVAFAPATSSTPPFDQGWFLQVLGEVEGLQLTNGKSDYMQECAVAGELSGPAYWVYTADAEYSAGEIDGLRQEVAALDTLCERGYHVNFVPCSLTGSEKKLLVMDVDSTLIGQEVIDELAVAAGRGAEVAAVTERAMRGELDFEQSLRERVCALAGLSEDVIAQVAGSVKFSAGAHELVSLFLEAGHAVCVVSGGFMQVLAPLAGELSLTRYRANRLEVDDGALTGKVTGQVVTAEVKRESLLEWAQEFGVDLSQVLAVGDGANDILMLGQAELGVAYCAKEALREVADAQVPFPRLDAVRHFVGL
ncbi:phosphoserine phosphatase SerB [Rothia sp. P4278]|uniref:phosphoserine phosphatase SerB n=1 Tax=Rothia sp. P4278 TaxID=3402658 RepID=UPI003AED8FD7